MATSEVHVAPPVLAPPAAEAAYVKELITRLEQDCPRRESASSHEMLAQELLGDELAARGCDVELQTFRFSPNLYAVIGLHCACATLGSAIGFWQPWLAAVLHLFPVISYLLDCHYRGYLLRRLVPWRTSHNLVARLPLANEGTPQQRIVFIAHADAAPTGWMFSPGFLRIAHTHWSNWLCLLRKQMLGWTLSLILLATLDVIYATTGHWRPPMYYGFTLASLIPLILMLQIVLTNRTVAGANDNLSGCAALPLLAERFFAQPLQDTEIVLVAAGCEEAGRGGAAHLEQQMRGTWDPRTTTIIGLDVLSSGQLRYHIEGEILPIYPSSELRQMVQELAASDDRFADMSPYHAPAGATDVAPFVWRGYDGLCISRIDPRSDIPPNYHVPSDVAANIDGDDVRDAVDFAEQLARKIASAGRLQRHEAVQTA